MSAGEERSDPRDYIVELSSKRAEGAEGAEPMGAEPAGRPFLSIYFRCCKVYQRLYRTIDGTAYAGHCPKCAKPARIKISPDGTRARFFTAE